ncbi:YbaB/EbfC family nucleoid-associated protein [Arundinibacter roseus]|uniref:Nucleoid-associated protein EZE20_15690 n=1 Tax=Arundinibacter roseus TaxID=2070510 RepID=A0A4R4KAS8_9BACT|nr:YbaB/EbfC family nucleoid-associated protein [Arundinibacter roseus]TDB63736.1 YbaB/EbfC family nucleoid-associated protein [Arundinibacter roseus]
MFGSMGDMMGLMGKMKDLQARMKEAQEQLSGITETAESGAGLVRATVNGQKKVVALQIDSDLLKPEDKEMMQDLVVAAVNKALDTIEPKIKEHLQKATDGLLPNIPGMDFGNLMK